MMVHADVVVHWQSLAGSPCSERRLFSLGAVSRPFFQESDWTAEVALR